MLDEAKRAGPISRAKVLEHAPHMLEVVIPRVDQAAPLPGVLHQRRPAGILTQGLGVAEHEERTLGTREGHVHAPLVHQEPHATTTRANAGEDDNVLLSP